MSARRVDEAGGVDQPDQDTILAAGVVLHDAAGRVALVHRPRYDDWSLPKGKLEPDEAHPIAAVRECEEETGVHARLEALLTEVGYLAGGRLKSVRYWRASVAADHGFTPGREIDGLRWLDPADAFHTLTNPADVGVVAASLAVGPTRAFVVLRHAEAVKRGRWAKDGGGRPDDDRPLTVHGLEQAAELAPLLGCYGIERIVTSPALRCRQTVDPLAALAGIEVEPDARYTEREGVEHPHLAAAAVTELAANPRRVVLCTHRPVLPTLQAALGALVAPDAADAYATTVRRSLAPADALVLHRDATGTVVAVERHPC